MRAPIVHRPSTGISGTELSDTLRGEPVVAWAGIDRLGPRRPTDGSQVYGRVPQSRHMIWVLTPSRLLVFRSKAHQPDELLAQVPRDHVVGVEGRRTGRSDYQVDVRLPDGSILGGTAESGKKGVQRAGELVAAAAGAAVPR